uniref:Tc1-like transposase DDE domain-containing protein n=1 Tax=Latimeria chalumnae TaxID=7897 RepID=H3AR58_LATCH
RMQEGPIIAKCSGPTHALNWPWFYQDGAPCHYDLNVRQLLNAIFPEKWIARCGPIAWPPRSPDLSPLDYFLWGYVKTVVYLSKPQSLDELRARIMNAIHEITQQQLENVFNELENWIERCITKDGSNFEEQI